MNTSLDLLLDRRAAGLLSAAEEADLRERALADPALRRALDADDAVAQAFVADRAAALPPMREPTPALLEQLLSTAQPAALASSASSAGLWTGVAKLAVGLGVFAGGFFGVRALVDAPFAEPVPQVVEVGTVKVVEPALVLNTAEAIARALPHRTVVRVDLSPVDDNRSRKPAAQSSASADGVQRTVPTTAGAVSTRAGTSRNEGVPITKDQDAH